MRESLVGHAVPCVRHNQHHVWTRLSTLVAEYQLFVPISVQRSIFNLPPRGHGVSFTECEIQ